MGRRKSYGFSFSWKRALGVSSAKQKLARFTGIPTTKQGRQRKVGRILTGNGCMFGIIYFLITSSLFWLGIKIAFAFMNR